MTLSGAAVGTLDVTVDLADNGIEYTGVTVAGDATLNAIAGTANDPIITLDVSGSGTITITVMRRAACAAEDYQVSGGGVPFSDAASTSSSSLNSNAYQVQYAALSITTHATTPATLGLGDTATRSLTITNGAAGYVTGYF